MKRRLVFFLATGALVSSALFACSGSVFVEAPEGEPSGPDPQADADADTPSVDGAVLVDGADPDAFIVKDAGEKTDGAGCEPTDCDCDKDGFNREGCGDGPVDCDDNDSRVRPNQGFLDILSDLPIPGDWNCSNRIEKLFAAKVNCGLLALGGCSGIQGFEGDPKCGEEGKYIFCKPLLVLCGVDDSLSQTRKQACK